MKIALPPPPPPPSFSAQQMPSAVQLPSATGPIPVPVPNLPGAASSFTPSTERRFSVRFLQGLGPRLKLAGLPANFAAQFQHRFAGASRTDLDREGRVIEGLLATAHPADALKLYDTLAKLQSEVTPGGFHVGANTEHSWTITPPKEDPFTFAGGALALADGTKLSSPAKGLLHLSHPTGGEARLKDTLSRGLTPKVMHAALSAATVAMSALSGREPSAGGAIGRAMEQGASLASRVEDGLHAALGQAPGKEKLLELAFAGGGGNPALSAALVLAVQSAFTLAETTPAVAHLVMGLLETAGRSAAPSRRADPELEKAVLLMELGSKASAKHDELGAELSTLGQKMRGAARETVLSFL